LAPLSGYSSSEALDINNLNYVVGWSFTPGGGSYQATLWDGAGQHALGQLANDSSSMAWGINDLNWVVGDSFSSSGIETHRAFFWSAGTGIFNLDALSGYGSSIAYRINSVGQVV